MSFERDALSLDTGMDFSFAPGFPATYQDFFPTPDGYPSLDLPPIPDMNYPGQDLTGGEGSSGSDFWPNPFEPSPVNWSDPMDNPFAGLLDQPADFGPQTPPPFNLVVEPYQPWEDPVSDPPEGEYRIPFSTPLRDMFTGFSLGGLDTPSPSSPSVDLYPPWENPVSDPPEGGVQFPFPIPGIGSEVPTPGPGLPPSATVNPLDLSAAGIPDPNANIPTPPGLSSPAQTPQPTQTPPPPTAGVSTPAPRAGTPQPTQGPPQPQFGLPQLQFSRFGFPGFSFGFGQAPQSRALPLSQLLLMQNVFGRSPIFGSDVSRFTFGGNRGISGLFSPGIFSIPSDLYDPRGGLLGGFFPTWSPGFSWSQMPGMGFRFPAGIRSRYNTPPWGY